ncbi:MAG: HAD-IIB family hydrolase, partial [Maribacter sp.]|nr:HAD-IIB family hydrolase [Maribacter sp.]
NEVEISSTLIDLEYVEKLHDLANNFDIRLGLYYKDEWYVEERTERVIKEIKHTKVTPTYRSADQTIQDWHKRNIGAHKIMLMGTQETIDDIHPELRVKFNSILNIYRSNDTLIEITPKSISKLLAIESLLGETASFNDIIAFGDNFNDSEMLQYAHCGVAVGNAREEIKAIADYTTLKNTEDGVAHFLKQHFNI